MDRYCNLLLVLLMNAFTEDYFLRGKDTGLSNFVNYSWMPDATIALATNLKRFVGIKEGDSVLDVGCARGYLVKALRILGVNAWGQDISEWSIANCDPEVVPFVSTHLNGQEFDYVVSKDMMEHVYASDLRVLVIRLLAHTKKKMFVIVPLAEVTDGRYVHPKEEQDSTHVNRWTLHDWLVFFQSCSQSFVISGSYRYPGLKPGCYECENGYGFFTLERIV